MTAPQTSSARSHSSYRTLLKQASALFTGEGAAHLLLLVGLPVMARLYPPEAFGLFGVFASCATFLGVLFSGRFELAIPTAHDEQEALQLHRLVQIISAVATLVIAIAGASIPQTIWEPYYPILLGLVCSLSVWCSSCRLMLSYKRAFKLLGRLRFLQACVTVGASAVLGLLNFETLGLIVGLLAGYVCHGALGEIWIGSSFPAVDKKVSRLSLMRSFRNYPLLSAPTHLLNAVTSQLVVPVVSYFFGLQIAGHFSLAKRVLEAPSALIGRTIHAVFFTEASCRSDDPSALKALVYRVLVGVGVFATVLFLSVLVLAPWMAPWIFGEEWDHIALFLQVLAIGHLVQFIHFPITSLFLVLNRQLLELRWQFTFSALVIIAITMGIISESWKLTLVSYGTAITVAYLTNVWMVLQALKAHKGGAGEAKTEIPAVPEELI